VDPDHIVGESRDVGFVVGDKKNRQGETRLQLAQLVAQPDAQRRVERGEGLVEQQRARLGGQGAGQRGALPLAAGELVGVAVGERPDLEGIEPAVGRGQRLAPARIAKSPAQAKETFCRTVRWGKSAYSWNT
jgi:hypothetical protein